MMSPDERAAKAAQAIIDFVPIRRAAGCDPFHPAQMVAIIADAIRVAEAAERERWLTAGLCDPTARRAHTADARGLVCYLLTGAPDAVAAALRAVSAAGATGIVGSYVPLPSDQFAAIAAAQRERCAVVAEATPVIEGRGSDGEPYPDGYAMIAAAAKAIREDTP